MAKNIFKISRSRYPCMVSANRKCVWFGSLAVLIWVLLCMLENTELQKWIRKTKYFRKFSFELLWKILFLSFLREALPFVWVNAIICLQQFFCDCYNFLASLSKNQRMKFFYFDKIMMTSTFTCKWYGYW